MKKFNLHKINKEELTKLHKNDLGMDIPKDYFKTSKSKIMEKVTISEKEKPRVFYLRPSFGYLMAASIIILSALSIVFKYNIKTKNNLNPADVENLANANDEDILINSLFVSDDDMSNFLDTYLVNNVVENVEVMEKEFDNIFLNSIIESDSLIDIYIDDNFVENIIL